MKFLSAIFITAFLVFESSCKRENIFICPELITPQKSASFHSGDTITISVYLPNSIQNAEDRTFINVWSYNSIYLYRSPVFDTIIFPAFNNNYYGTANLVFSTIGNQVDTFYIAVGIGSPGTGITCQGIPVYINL